MISVFFDFRVYRAFVNTEIKEHGIIICRFEAQLRLIYTEFILIDSEGLS